MVAGLQQRSRTTGKRAWVVAVVGLLLVVAILAGIKFSQIGTMIQAGKQFVPPPESVTSAKVEALEWQSSRSAIGTLVAIRGVTLASEVPGMVREIRFE